MCISAMTTTHDETQLHKVPPYALDSILYLLRFESSDLNLHVLHTYTFHFYVRHKIMKSQDIEQQIFVICREGVDG